MPYKYYILCINKPLLNLGSNHVDLGGISLLLSETANNSEIEVGYIENAITQSRLHLLSNSFKPLIPPTKSILASYKTDTSSSKEKLSNADIVYAALKRNPKQTKEDVSKATGLSRATITRTYSELEEQGKIHRVGSNKTGYWEVK